MVTTGMVAVAGSPPAEASDRSVSTAEEYRAALTELSSDDSGPHTVTLAADVVLTAGTDPTYTGTQPLVVDGGGHTIDADLKGRALLADTVAAVTVRHLSVVDGRSHDDEPGGGVHAGGALTLEDTSFSTNASPDGGAVAAASVRVVDSVLRENTTSGRGGAVFSTGAVTLERTSLLFNEAGRGGGGVAGGDLVVTNSSLLANRSGTGAGGNLHATGSVSLVHASLVYGRAGRYGTATGQGVNVRVGPGQAFSSFGSVLAENPDDPRPSCVVDTAAVTSGGFNWVNEAAGADTCGLTAPTDIHSPGARPAVSYSEDSGEVYPTDRSPLRDAIPPEDCDPAVVTDQRGGPRPQPAGGACDIGASEPTPAELVFSRDPAGGDDTDRDLWTMTTDGSHQAQLTDGDANDTDPAWSPDGTRIAFARTAPGECCADLYIVGVDGSGLTQVTDSADDDGSPTWSPDGTRLAFESTRGGNTDVFAVEISGGGEVRLTDDPGADTDPDWSPDGTRLAFASDRGGGDPDIFVMSADGADEQSLTGHPAPDTDPAWSPDGAELAFASPRDGRGSIRTMLANGRANYAVTMEPGRQGSPSWAPGPDTYLLALDNATTTTDEAARTGLAIVQADGLGYGSILLGDPSDRTPDYNPVARLSQSSPDACRGWAVTVDVSAGERPTSGADVLGDASTGDVVRGGGGDDLWCAQEYPGDNTVFLGAGDDRAFGGHGAERLSGGAGDDRLFGAGGRDVLAGGEGDDILDGGHNTDRLDGGAGRDTCRGGPRVDSATACEVTTGIP